MSEELRPCPFCGLHVELVSAKTYPNGERSPAYIKCKRCNYHIAGYEDKDVINQWNTRSAIRKEFCPNCEKDTECIHAAELYECQECGEDFAKYIVPRTAPCTAVNEPSNSDVSMTQDILTPIKTSQSNENTNPDYYKHDAVSWIPISENPTKSDWYLIMYQGYRVPDADYYDVEAGWLSDIPIPDYWMPMPEPPEVK